jgi:Membrane bound FAD containing D-sorbitol dehydrogenase
VVVGRNFMKKNTRNGARQGSAAKPAKGKTSSAGAVRSRHDEFLHLSRVLTAHALDSHLAELYLERMRDAAGSQLDDLLDRFQALVKDGNDPVVVVRNEILPDTVLGPIAKAVLLLWYIGGIQRTPGGDWEMQSAGQYYRALVWEAIGAHPPTLSNGYFGHWKYPPEM